MKLSPIKVIIIDDVGTYFNEQMLSIASANGNISFERYRKCDATLLKSLVANPRDILIMDIKGTVTKDIGKDGFDVTKHVFENTNTFLVITSAHKHHLRNQSNYGDYVIVDRLLTPLDFCNELDEIIDVYLKRKINFYKKLTYKLGKTLARKKIAAH
ncbi:hypothetical protein [Winogradskyella sp.]